MWMFFFQQNTFFLSMFKNRRSFSMIDCKELEKKKEKKSTYSCSYITMSPSVSYGDSSWTITSSHRGCPCKAMYCS